jgi:hypothetical protein
MKVYEKALCEPDGRMHCTRTLEHIGWWFDCDGRRYFMMKKGYTYKKKEV